jgi:hypothetical protein
MAGFTSQDDLLNQITTNSKFFRADWNKLFNPTAAAVAGEWHTLFRGTGNPTADSLFNTGTNLQMQNVFDQDSTAASILHGGNIGATGADYKVLLNASVFTNAATSVPCILMLVDVLSFIRVTTVTTATAQTVLNAVTFTANAGTDIITYATVDPKTYTKVRFTTTTTLPAPLVVGTDYWLIRQSSTTAKIASSYANAIAGTAIDITDTGTGTHTMTTRLPRYTDGAGVQAIIFNSNATALGAATPNMTLTYTNAAGTASRTTPTTLPIGKTGATNSHIIYSGATGVGKYGPFVPLQSTDTGIQTIQSIQNSVSYVSGEYSVAQVKPIVSIPITTLGVPGEREFGSMIPSFPRIYDGAALYWLMFSGAATPANSAFYGHLDFGWS